LKTRQRLKYIFPLFLLLTFFNIELYLFAQTDTTQTRETSFIIISDTQSPIWFEKIFVKTHRNEEATKILFSTIAKDTSISAVFFLGDVTAMSSFNSNWEIVDTLLEQLKLKNISAYATAGNHDYLFSSAKGEANLKKRFPNFCRTGFTIRLGTFAFILLNSNYSVLNDSEEVKQEEWYQREFHFLDQDTTIKIIAVGCHHSPFSNSSIVGHSQIVQDKFIPPFLDSKKSKFFISGHAHTFQHFKDTLFNKDFLVIGGGGGLLHTLKEPKPYELKDRFYSNAEYRMFHFVKCVLLDNALNIYVMMLTEDFEKLETIYSISYPIAN
jgi:predicted phosphodiesterase